MNPSLSDNKKTVDFCSPSQLFIPCRMISIKKLEGLLGMCGLFYRPGASTHAPYARRAGRPRARQGVLQITPLSARYPTLAESWHVENFSPPTIVDASPSKPPCDSTLVTHVISAIRASNSFTMDLAVCHSVMIVDPAKNRESRRSAEALVSLKD